MTISVARCARHGALHVTNGIDGLGGVTASTRVSSPSCGRCRQKSAGHALVAGMAVRLPDGAEEALTLDDLGKRLPRQRDCFRSARDECAGSRAA
jgi:hypothetical protein